MQSSKGQDSETRQFGDFEIRYKKYSKRAILPPYPANGGFKSCQVGIFQYIYHIYLLYLLHYDIG